MNKPFLENLPLFFNRAFPQEVNLFFVLLSQYIFAVQQCGRRELIFSTPTLPYFLTARRHGVKAAEYPTEIGIFLY